MLLGSLRGLRVQILLWTVLPLTLVLVAVAVIGISTHQRSMRDLVEELDARSARLAAAHLSESLEERVALLEVIDTSQPLPWSGQDGLTNGSGRLATGDALDMLFDGGLARCDASGNLVDASPSAEIWRARPISELLARASSPDRHGGKGEDQGDRQIFSPLFVDPATGRDSLLIGWALDDGSMIVGAVSLERLELPELMVQASDTRGNTSELRSGSPSRRSARSAMLRSSISNRAIVFLVDTDGQVIYHPDKAQLGQNLKEHAGVRAVIQGRAGATYHQEPDGRELVVGYAPVPGPGWGLIVQEPWEALIAPVMRLSLMAPLTAVVAALVSGLAVTFGLRYVVRPLQALDEQTMRVAWGDFSAVDEPLGGVQEIEDLRRTLEGMAKQIQRYQAGMRDYIAAVTAAQEEERKRLARELHDETVQSLIALGHRVEMAQKALSKDPERAQQRLAELREMTTEIQAEVRRFSQALRPLYLEDLGFVPALEMLAQEMGRGNDLAVSLQVEGEVRRLAPDLELTAYRIAQEGLSNVVRHASAKTAWLMVVFATDGLTLRVRDDGRGFEPPVNPADLARTGHFGLMGIRERALLFGGRLEIRSRPGAGTTLEVCLPLKEILDPQTSQASASLR